VRSLLSLLRLRYRPVELERFELLRSLLPLRRRSFKLEALECPLSLFPSCLREVKELEFLRSLLGLLDRGRQTAG
jgi:hypothetical protein